MKGNSFSYVILLICLTVVSCEFYSSVHEVTKLAGLERLLLGKMERFVTLNENKLDYLKEKLSEFEREREDAIESGEEYFENPINKYLLTKRLSLDWEKLENFLDHEVGTSILKSIDKFRSNYTFPEEDDFNGAIEGILRLQQVYRLKTKDIAQGILNGVKYSTELSAKDCFDFGKVALKENNLLAAHAWLTEALESFDSFDANVFDEKFEKPDILEPLAEVKFKLSDFNGAAEMLYALNLWRPNDKRLMDLYTYYTQYAYSRPSYRVETEHEPVPSDLDSVEPELAYQYTCNGHIHQSASDERPLRCSYLTETHPFLLLAPIKVEVLFEDPLLLVFHDVIHDNEVKKLIELANDKIQRARLFDVNGSHVSKIRTSHSVFFKTETDKVFQKIDQRVADMTGLNMAVAEEHQIANYGIGGHYGPHRDFFYPLTKEVAKLELGNRMATVLFYYIPANLDDIDEFMAYRLTCSEHIHQTPSEERDLRCGYLTETHPFLLLAPLKFEQLSVDPLLLVFHEVIYDSEIEKVIQLANGKIERATVLSKDGSMVSSVRTSHFAFFEHDADPVLQTIDQRVADMTGLNMKSAEKHQIANYGIGGHYGQHCDFFHNLHEGMSDFELGNRIATVLFYLTDVEQGGGTAFQYMKRLVKPKKGAAAFWYNLHATGDGDGRTKHGACPMLVGSKWVLNRWIRVRGQEFIRPCSLTSDALETAVMF